SDPGTGAVTAWGDVAEPAAKQQARSRAGKRGSGPGRLPTASVSPLVWGELSQRCRVADAAAEVAVVRAQFGPDSLAKPDAAAEEQVSGQPLHHHLDVLLELQVHTPKHLACEDAVAGEVVADVAAQVVLGHLASQQRAQRLRGDQVDGRIIAEL